MRLARLVPLLLPIAATGVAVYEGRYAGGITGLFAGILCDISFNKPVGVFTVLLTVTGLFIGAIADAVMMRGFVTYYLSCAFVLIVSAGVQMFPLVFLENISLGSLLITAIQQTLYSLILAFPIWFFVRALGKHTERTQSSGRPL